MIRRGRGSRDRELHMLRRGSSIDTVFNMIISSDRKEKMNKTLAKVEDHSGSWHSK